MLRSPHGISRGTCHEDSPGLVLIIFNDFYYSNVLNKLGITDSFSIKHFYDGTSILDIFLIINDCIYAIDSFGILKGIAESKNYLNTYYIMPKYYIPGSIQSNKLYWKRKKE